jgi:hypothetical protein
MLLHLDARNQLRDSSCKAHAVTGLRFCVREAPEGSALEANPVRRVDQGDGG